MIESVPMAHQLEMIKQQISSLPFIYLKIRVSPKSRETGFYEVMGDGTLKMRLKSPPEKGKANKELLEYLSDFFGISKQNIEIVGGLTERDKLVKLSSSGYNM